MDDLHRAPGEGDRKQLRERINRAVASGQIGAVDGDIRLANVSSAQSLTELSLIARDLDQLEAARAQTVRAAAVAAPAPAQSEAAPFTPPPGQPAASRFVPLVILGVVVFLVLVGVAGLFVFSTSSNNEVGAEQPPFVVESASAGDPVPAGPGDPVTVVRFERTAAGITTFLRQYRDRFGTARATELTMYEDYAIVRVPVPGRDRDAGWIYRDGGWTEFGGVRATSPGTRVVDLTRLDVAALLRTMGRAKRSLDVEDATISHVSIDFRSAFDDVPNVRVYASNTFGESGYLATTLSGTLVRSYPYSR
ncbi:MAG: hypothetical protein NTV23_09150 [Propionibacteriales bacterium]|nr:hypothetical protein [Propionibacteriales bacterium]